MPQTPAPRKSPTWSEWPFLKHLRELPQQVVTDVKETAQDLVDEPNEVPYRIGERLKDYVRPRHRVSYPSPSKPK